MGVRAQVCLVFVGVYDSPVRESNSGRRVVSQVFYRSTMLQGQKHMLLARHHPIS